MMAGEPVQRFLKSVAMFSAWYTFQPTAPNDPGVNAVGISMQDRDRLCDKAFIEGHPEYGILVDVLRRAVSYNLLYVDFGKRVKDKEWAVFNLNRLLCVKYYLPLGHCLFKEQRLDTLLSWVTTGFSEPT